MPAFLVGHGFARVLSHMIQVPMYEFAHQENHILAALREVGHVPTIPFYRCLLYTSNTKSTTYYSIYIYDVFVNNTYDNHHHHSRLSIYGVIHR